MAEGGDLTGETAKDGRAVSACPGRNRLWGDGVGQGNEVREDEMGVTGLREAEV